MPMSAFAPRSPVSKSERSERWAAVLVRPAPPGFDAGIGALPWSVSEVRAGTGWTDRRLRTEALSRQET